MTILESILKSLRNAASYNRHELAAPLVVLWPDEERLWTQCIEPLRASYPALWSLGDYATDKATGPAAWLRYQLETQSGEDVPVIYLPGIGRPRFPQRRPMPESGEAFICAAIPRTILDAEEREKLDALCVLFECRWWTWVRCCW